MMLMCLVFFFTWNIQSFQTESYIAELFGWDTKYKAAAKLLDCQTQTFDSIVENILNSSIIYSSQITVIDDIYILFY